MLFFSLAILRPHVLLARTIAPLTRIAHEAFPGSSVPPAPATETVAPPEAAATAFPDDAAAAGSLSIGEPSHGRLFNGLQLTTDEHFQVRSSDENWGTAETVDGIRAAVTQVDATFPGAPRLVVGDLSKEHGGRIWPHKSHQSGRDIDLGFYLKGGQASTFTTASGANLDLERTWALIQALAATDSVQYIFIDRRVQKVIYDFAKDEKHVPAAILSSIFEYPGRNSMSTLVRHRRGHRDHLHVRFFSPLAVAAGEKFGAGVMASAGTKLDPWQRMRFVHTVHKGDTLARIAQRYRLDVTDVMRWNRLKRNSMLHLGQNVALFRRVKVAVATPAAPPQDVCHAGPRGAVGCWHPSHS